MKKLLGLLAVAPLTLAACGGNDTVENTVIENDVRFVMAHDDYESKVIVSGIELSGSDDVEGYNALGKAIMDAYTDNAALAAATTNALLEINLIGTYEGVVFDKEILVKDVKDGGNGKPFTTLNEILTYDFQAIGEFTADGVMAHHLKDAGDHTDPVAITDKEYETFSHELMDGRETMVSTLTQTAWDAKFYATDSETTEYDINEFDVFLGVSADEATFNVTTFNDTGFVFEKYVVGSRNRVHAFYHHESDPSTAEVVQWTITTA